MSRFRPLWILLVLAPSVALLVAPSTARASSVSAEGGVGSTQPTTQNPRTGNEVLFLSSSLDLSDAWALHADVGYTHDNPSRRSSSSSFATTGGNIFVLAPGVEFNPTDHWTLGLDVDLSPTSKQSAGTVITETNGTTSTDVNARLATATSSIGTSALVGWNSASLSDWETEVDLSIAATGYNTVQRVDAIQTASGPVTASGIQSYCAKATTATALAACKPLLAAIRGAPDTLLQGRIALNAVETIHDDTDVGLTGTYFLYDQDPTTVGYFSLLTVGRSVSMGNGLAVLPAQFSLRPMVGHRFGRLGLELAYQFIRYVDDLGAGHGVTARIQYKFDRNWKLWVKLTGQLDVTSTTGTTHSGTMSAGIRYTF